MKRAQKYKLIFAIIFLAIASIGCKSGIEIIEVEDNYYEETDFYAFQSIKYTDVTPFGHPNIDWLRENQLDFSFSMGITKPGEVIGFSGSRILMDITIHIQLFKVDQEYNITDIKDEFIYTSQTPKDRINYSYELPLTENALYLLIVEFIQDEDIKNTLGAFIYVPIQELHAEMKTNKKRYLRNRNVEIEIRNNGPTILEFGRPYTIELLREDKWKEITSTFGFTLEGLQIKPGETYVQPLNTYHLRSGHYRVSKNFRAAGTDLEKTIFAEFTIK
ncbi:immunoglobulin-like domain-containing protein [Desulfuribacillus alkaliarsenatis]|uniref:Bacterial Ig-like domain-containing protein n=1 Tax=Desulfuribacillus alkaliarsenatis TaxID=766136 RepID=A0A1E5G0D8_9FIRM|nr:immunoglobulin-like domain-containing protein [Desulfuribacillus alkaliarsenatis]OEF96169.1 hypothetical protein BHF68_08350 [Desulfuribacillus alkaliarsenatis]